MTKREADRLLEALQRIEEGNVYIGASILRGFLREIGYPAPLVLVPGRVAEAEPPRQGSDR